MPFTPLHMLPVLPIKILAPSRFSLLGYGAIQILMDVEPLYKLLTHQDKLHSFTHSIWHTPYMVLLCYLFYYVGVYLRFIPSVPFRLVLVTVFIGVYAHIFLDSLFHSDVTVTGWCNSYPAMYICSHSGLLCLGLIYAGFGYSILWFIYKLCSKSFRTVVFNMFRPKY